MPKRKFVYSREAGKVVEVTDEHTKELCDEISEAVKPFNESFTERGSNRWNMGALWPRKSLAMAINPRDIKRAQAKLAKHGIYTEYDNDGQPILRDKKHERQHMACMGFFHKNAGYSDRAPEVFTMDYHPDNVEARNREFLENLTKGKMYF